MYKNIFLKKIKNILLILVVVFLVLINQVNAEDKCLIKDAPSKIIINYKKVLSKKVSDIISEASKNTKNTDNSFTGRMKASGNKVIKDFTRIGKSISAKFNGGWNWGGYYTYWNFYVIKPLFSSIPYPVRRDHDLLKKESEKLVKLQKFLIKKGDTISVEKITNLIVINNQVLNCFRQQIVNLKTCDIKTFNGKKSNEIIGDINIFLKEFKKIYNDSTSQKCGTSVMKEIGDKFNSISETLKGNGSAFQDWQDAIKMILNELPGGQTDREMEKKLLIKELQRQGLSSNAINKMTKNLDNMNDCLDKGIGKDGKKIKGSGEDGKATALDCIKLNNPFTNTLESVKDSFQDMRDGFNDAIKTQDKIADKNRKSSLKSSGLKDSPIYKTLDLIEKKGIKDGTEVEIENLFNFNSALIDIPDGGTKNLEGKIINSHINLNSAIKTLDATIDISRKVCKAQHQGVGICK